MSSISRSAWSSCSLVNSSGAGTLTAGVPVAAADTVPVAVFRVLADERLAVDCRFVVVFLAAVAIYSLPGKRHWADARLRQTGPILPQDQSTVHGVKGAGPHPSRATLSRQTALCHA